MTYTGEAQFRYQGPKEACVPYIRQARTLADKLMQQHRIGQEGGIESASGTYRFTSGAWIKVQVFANRPPIMTINVEAVAGAKDELGPEIPPTGLLVHNDSSDPQVQAEDFYVLRYDGKRVSWWEVYKRSVRQGIPLENIYRLYTYKRAMQRYRLLDTTDSQVPDGLSLDYTGGAHLGLQLATSMTHVLLSPSGEVISVDAGMTISDSPVALSEVVEEYTATTWRAITESGSVVFIHCDLRDRAIIGSPGDASFCPYNYKWAYTKNYYRRDADLSSYVGDYAASVLTFWVSKSPDYEYAKANSVPLIVDMSAVNPNITDLGGVVPLDISSDGKRLMVLGYSSPQSTGVGPAFTNKCVSEVTITIRETFSGALSSTINSSVLADYSNTETDYSTNFTHTAQVYVLKREPLTGNSARYDPISLGTITNDETTVTALAAQARLMIEGEMDSDSSIIGGFYPRWVEGSSYSRRLKETPMFGFYDVTTPVIDFRVVVEESSLSTNTSTTGEVSGSGTLNIAEITGISYEPPIRSYTTSTIKNVVKVDRRVGTFAVAGVDKYHEEFTVAESRTSETGGELLFDTSTLSGDLELRDASVYKFVYSTQLTRSAILNGPQTPAPTTSNFTNTFEGTPFANGTSYNEPISLVGGTRSIPSNRYDGDGHIVLTGFDDFGLLWQQSIYYRHRAYGNYVPICNKCAQVTEYSLEIDPTTSTAVGRRVSRGAVITPDRVDPQLTPPYELPIPAEYPDSISRLGRRYVPDNSSVPLERRCGAYLSLTRVLVRDAPSPVAFVGVAEITPSSSVRPATMQYSETLTDYVVESETYEGTPPVWGPELGGDV